MVILADFPQFISLQSCLDLLRFVADVSTLADQKVKRGSGKPILKVLNMCVLNSFLDQGDYIGKVISVYLRREAAGGRALWRFCYCEELLLFLLSLTIAFLKELLCKAPASK